MIIASVFELEGPGSIPDTTKDPPSVCDVHAWKIFDPVSPVVGL